MSETAEVKKKKNIVQVLLSPAFLLLFLAYIMACLSFSCTGSVFVKYGVEYLGLPQVQVGVIAGIISMVGLVMRPVTAILVDKFNRKGMLLFCYGMLSLSCLLMFMSSSIPALWIAQIVRGAAWALQNSAGYIMVGEIVDEDDLATAMNVYSLAMTLAASFSAVLILAIANSFGYRTCFIATLVFGAIAFLLTLAIPYVRKTQAKQSLGESIRSIRLSNLFSIACVPIIVITFLMQFVSTMMGSSWIVRFGSAELNIANAGLFATISNVIMYFSRPFWGRVMDKRNGTRWTLLATCVGYAASCFIVANANGIGMLYAASAVMGVLGGGFSQLGATMAMRRLGAARRAVARSTVGIGSDIGLFAGNVVIPAVSEMCGSYRPVYSIFGVVSLVVCVYGFVYGAIYLKRHPENEMNW